MDEEIECPLCGTKSKYREWTKKIVPVYYIQCPECWFTVKKKYVEGNYADTALIYSECFAELRYIDKCIELAKVIDDLMHIINKDR